jgi:myo-inositol-1(or 4)-monophosphatase
MQPLLNIAIRAARRAGEVIVRGMNRVHRLDIRAKGQNDFVTEIDTQAEREIIDIVHKHYPQHAFLAEESGASGGPNNEKGDGDNEFLWIIDPLDGTTNFLHGYPQFAVSIGVQRRGRMEHAVVYDPLRQELFTASRGEGAQLDGKRIRVTAHVGLDRSLIGTGFPYRSNLQWLDPYMEMLKAVTQATAGIRRPGAAALDLAYVAAGRLDAFWELGLSPWDIVVGTPKVYAPLIELLAPYIPVDLRN